MKRSTKCLLIISLCLLIVYLLITIINAEKEIIYKKIYIIIYFLILAFYVLKESKNLISIKSLYLLMYTLMFGLSPFFYIINNNSFTIQGNSISYQYPIAIIGLLVLLFSYYAPISNKKKNNENTLDTSKLKYNFTISILLIAISTIANLYFIYKNRIYLFSSNIESARIEALSGNGLIILLAGLNLIGVSLLFDFYIKTNRKKIPLIISILILVITSIIRGFRTPILKLFVIMVLIYNHERKIKLKSLFFLILFSIVLLSVLTIIRAISSGNNITMQTALFNSLQVGSINYNYVFRTFPDKIPFQKGYSFLINLKMMLPGKDPDFTLWLKDAIGISFSGGGVTPTLFGEGYLNFGIIGGLIELFIIGLLGRKFDQNYLIKSTKSFWTIFLSIILLDAFRGGFANVEIALISTFFVYMGYSILYSSKNNKD